MFNTIANLIWGAAQLVRLAFYLGIFVMSLIATFCLVLALVLPMMASILTAPFRLIGMINHNRRMAAAIKAVDDLTALKKASDVTDKTEQVILDAHARKVA